MRSEPRARASSNNRSSCSAVIASAGLLVATYMTLRRRIGPVVADWFVLGYVMALLVVVAGLMGGQVVEFLRGQLELRRDT